MKHEGEMTDKELLTEGMALLNEQLGIVDAMRFIVIMKRERATDNERTETSGGVYAEL